MAPKFTSMAASTCEGGSQTDTDVGDAPERGRRSLPPSGRDFGDHVLEPSIGLAVRRNVSSVLCIALVAHGRRHGRYSNLAVAEIEILGLAADRLGGLGRFGRFHFSLRPNCFGFLLRFLLRFFGSLANRYEMIGQYGGNAR